MDDITIGVTENVNNISVTAQPNDQIIDIAVTETVETVLLDVSTTVQEVSVTATQNVIVENITVDYVSNENHIDINVTDASQDVTLNVTPTLIEINILRSGGEVNILQFDSLADFPTTGSSDYFYLAKDTNKLYRWTGSAYAEISATANAVWGQIIGTLSEQTDLQNALNLKAPINSPTFTGTVSGITKAMVGLGQVDNTSDLDKPISTATQTALNNKQPLDGDLTSIAALSDTFGLLKKTANNSYTIDTNTYLTGITSSDVTTALGYTPENVANKGVNNGYASLGGDGKVPSSQLPSYVDDVIEVANYASLPSNGETGKIYITLDTNKIYRWTGSVYVEVSSSAAVWGGITGTLSNQTDLQTALDAKQDDLNGTGFVKASGTTISYDNTTYYPASNPNGYTTNTGTVTSVALTVPSAFSVSGSPVTSSGTLAITGAGTTAQYVRGDGTLATMPDISGFVPYTGATANVDLGTHTIIAAKGTFSSSGSDNTVNITHSSGSGIALNISKAGNGEGIYVNKTSGSGNAATIIGTLNATTLVKSGGTSTQFLKADGSVDSSTYLTSASLSGYVDTTGDQSIAGQKTFTGFAYFDNTIFLKQTTSISFISGYNSIAASSSGIRMGITSGISALFDLTSLTSNRDYILPNASGTFALLSDIPSLAGYVATTGTQSIGGTKTFTSYTLFDQDIYLKHDGTLSGFPGYSTIAANATSIIFGLPDLVSVANFDISALTAQRYYNLPDANGIIALTSQLHNAVTIGTANGLSLSTQVLSLALASTSSNGALSSTDWNTFNGKQNALTNPVTGTGTTNYLPKFTGTSAIGNSLLYDTGSVLLVGATSASDGQSKLELVSAGPVGLKIISSAANGNNTFLSIQSSKEWRFLTNRGDISGNQGDLIIRNNTDGINHIILNQDGATTFASTVTATGFEVGNGQFYRARRTSSNLLTDMIGIPSGTNDVRVLTTGAFSVVSGGLASFLHITDTGNVGIGTTTISQNFSGYTHLDIGNATNGGVVLFSNGTGTNYGYINGASSGVNIRSVTGDTTFGNNIGVQVMKITSAGNLGIGTGSPTHKLSVLNAANGTIASFTNGSDADLSISLTSGVTLLTPSTSILAFGTSSTERIRISGANVGIGTTAPGVRFVNSGGALASVPTLGSGTIGANAILSSNGLYGLYTGVASEGWVWQQVQRNDGGTSVYPLILQPSGGNVLVGTTSDNGIKFQVSGDTYATGYVYFKNQASSNNFAWYGNTNILLYNSAVGNIASINASTGIYVATSDINKKKDLEESKIGLNEVMQLKPTLYRMKTDETKGEKELGFIAQDVKGIIPSAYQESGDFIGLNFNPIVAALTKAVQELKAELDTLKNK